MARRTRSWYTYEGDDHGALTPTTAWSVLVPDDEALELPRGWVAAVGPADTTPQRTKLRHVVGRDPSGNAGRAICATTSCDLWTGTATSFTVDGVAFDVTGFVGEKRTIAQN